VGTYPERLRQPSSRALTLLTGCSPCLLTRITSVPECAVSSVGFLWDQPPCRGVVGFLWGSPKLLTSCRPDAGHPGTATFCMLAISLRLPTVTGIGSRCQRQGSALSDGDVGSAHGLRCLRMGTCTGAGWCLPGGHRCGLVRPGWVVIIARSGRLYRGGRPRRFRTAETVFS
jgi:hypothetical protein